MIEVKDDDHKKTLSSQMNWFDKTIAAISPAAGLSRAKARDALRGPGAYAGRGNHSGASKSRKALSDWVVGHILGGDSPDATNSGDLPTLRERSRDLVRNNPLATGIINTKVTSIVGTGIKVQSRIDHQYLGISPEQATEWQRGAEREFDLFAESKSCDVYDTSNFYELQELVLRARLESGDVFAVLARESNENDIFDLKIQLVEADRISNPNFTSNDTHLVDGVVKDAKGAPTGYWIASGYHSDLTLGKTLTWRKIAAKGSITGAPNVLHIYKVLRPSSSRGVPDLAPVIENLKQLGRYTEAELMAAVISGMLTLFIETDIGDQDFAQSMSSDGKTANPSYTLGNGTIVELPPGQTVKDVNPGRPNAAFDPFVLANLRQIGACVEIPYELLIKHFTASYSASRAALLEFMKMVKAQRRQLVNQFCKPIYELVLTEAITAGRLSAPGFLEDQLKRRAYLRAEWYGDAPGLLNPLQEVNAATARVEGGFSTRAQETIELTGGDWEVDQDQRAKENNSMIADGTKLDPALEMEQAAMDGSSDTPMPAKKPPAKKDKVKP